MMMAIWSLICIFRGGVDDFKIPETSIPGKAALSSENLKIYLPNYFIDCNWNAFHWFMTGEEGKRGLFTCEGGRLELLPVKGEEGKGRMLQRQERRRTDNDLKISSWFIYDDADPESAFMMYHQWRRGPCISHLSMESWSLRKRNYHDGDLQSFPCWRSENLNCTLTVWMAQMEAH